MGVSPETGNWEFEGRSELERRLEEFGLEKSDICLVGSISLSARGLREHGDLDFCVRSGLRHQIDDTKLDGFVALVEQRYENIDLSDDELIEDDQYHDVIDSFKVVRPEITFSYKKLRDLPKDEKDIELLERYAVATDDWDWELYRSDYSQRPNSLLSRGIQSLQTDGVVITASKVVGLLARKSPFVRRAMGAVPVYDLQTPWDATVGRERLVSTASLLNRQYAGTTFTRYDTVAYYAAIESLADGNKPSFDISKLDVDRSTLDEIATGERHPEEPVSVSPKHRVLDPLSLAQLLHENRNEVRIRPRLRRGKRSDEEWLREREFDEDEMKALEEIRLSVLEDVGVLFYAIFWPTTHEYFDEMEASLGEKVQISESMEIEVDDIKGFVKAIYDAQADHAPTWAIDWKADHMTNFPPVVRVVKIELPNPRLRDGISREMEMIKNDVRHEYVEHFPDKYYLSLLHATDSFGDNLEVRDVIDEYA